MMPVDDGRCYSFIGCLRISMRSMFILHVFESWLCSALTAGAPVIYCILLRCTIGVVVVVVVVIAVVFAWLQSICAVFVTTRMGYIVLLPSCKHLKACICMCAYWFLQIRAQRTARGYAQRGPLAGGGDMPGWHQAAAWQILLLFRFARLWGLVQAACIVRPLALEVEDVPLLPCRCASLSTEPSASMLLRSESYYQ